MEEENKEQPPCAPFIKGEYFGNFALLPVSSTIDATKRQACAQKKLSSQHLCKTFHDLRRCTLSYKESDFNSSQILHYERFLCVYACHD
jgi:hypothetical protein